MVETIRHINSEYTRRARYLCVVRVCLVESVKDTQYHCLLLSVYSIIIYHHYCHISGNIQQ